ncbi:MAG: Tim44 domain-containing protein [Bacilli bacterium]|nr:Tim44 domain-containing protein [Bacilli bacterium]
MKKKFIVFLIVIGMLFSGVNLVKADSGWDSSYDSGGGWDSGGWDSGGWDSDWDSGGGWSSSSSDGSYSDGDGFAFMIIFAVIVIIIIYFSINNRGGKGGSGSTSNFNKYSDIKDDRLKKIGMDADEFKKLAFELYKSIQEEWMNFDYDGLRKHLTDELYNSYVMQLDALKVKGQQNIMKGFENIDVKITNITEEAGIVNVTVYLHTAMYDYVVDNNKKTVRGKDNHKIDIEYSITFVKASDESLKKCPNCGAPFEGVAGGKCEYCGSTIVIGPKEYVMSKKTCIGQRMR